MSFKIGWFIGRYNWAYRNLAKILSKHMPNQEHLTDDFSGDVIMVMSLDQLGKKKRKHANRTNRKRSSSY